MKVTRYPLLIPSDSSIDKHPNNKIGDFTVEFNKPLELGNGAWMMVLESLSYPQQWSNILKDNTFHVLCPQLMADSAHPMIENQYELQTFVPEEAEKGSIEHVFHHLKWLPLPDGLITLPKLEFQIVDDSGAVVRFTSGKCILKLCVERR